MKRFCLVVVPSGAEFEHEATGWKQTPEGVLEVINKNGSPEQVATYAVGQWTRIRWVSK